jgi:hypothetical protein
VEPGRESPPPQLRPFEAQPRRSAPGCGRVSLIGCGVATALLGVAAIVLMFYAKDILVWTIHEIQSEVMAKLPPDVTVEERARLDRGFAAAIDHIRTGKFEAPALTALQRQLTMAAKKAPAGTLTHDDVLDLLSALERVGGLLRPDESTPPGPPVSGPENRPPPAEGTAPPSAAPPSP